MFRSLGSVLCVVVMAAFVFGCGGGKSKPSVAPGPTDEQRIAQARQEIASILSTARTQAQAASSAASSIQANADATAAQIASAASSNTAAQAALKLIESASSTASAATTPAAAQTALESAKTAQGNLNTAASAITSIQNALQAIADARNQRKADDLALTGGSSLIKHLRANKLLADAVLGTAGANLTAASLVVGAAGDEGTLGSGVRAGCTAPCAEYHLYTGTGAGADRVTGQRTVRITPTGGTLLTSSSTTLTLTGTSTLSHGFDLNNAPTPGTDFVNAYTDVDQERRGAKNQETDPGNTTPYDETYDYILDTDYLLAGIWMRVDTSTLSASRITAFAYGSQPLDTTIVSRCGATEGTETASVISGSVRLCNTDSSASNIGDFVEDGRNVDATYSGKANGTYLAGSDTSYFTGDVTLTAEFKNPTTGDNSGSIEGAVTNIVAGGQSMPGSIELRKHTFGNAIGELFGTATGNNPPRSAVGVVDGKSFDGHWKGQFFGQEFRRVSASEPNPGYDSTNTTDTSADLSYHQRRTRVDYKSQAPGSVAGTFYATQQSNPVGSAAFIGAFGAHRP